MRRKTLCGLVFGLSGGICVLYEKYRYIDR